MPFAEVVVTTPAEVEEVFERARVLTDPPAGLVAVVGWETGPDEVTVVMVWSDPSARGDAALERFMPMLEDGTFRPTKPERIHPTHLLVRGNLAETVGG